MAQDRRLDTRKALIALMGTPVLVDSFTLFATEYDGTTQLEEDGLYLVSSTGLVAIQMDTVITLTGAEAIIAGGVFAGSGVPYRVFLQDTYRFIKLAHADPVTSPIYVNVFKLS